MNPRLPAGAAVRVLADRFYPSVALLEWLRERGWRHRFRLNGKLGVDSGVGVIVTTGAPAAGHTER